MDFTIGLPRSRKHDSIWKIADRMKNQPLLAGKDHSFGKQLYKVIHLRGGETTLESQFQSFHIEVHNSLDSSRSLS